MSSRQQINTVAAWLGLIVQFFGVLCLLGILIIFALLLEIMKKVVEGDESLSIRIGGTTGRSGTNPFYVQMSS